MVVREWEPEDRPRGEAPVVVDGRYAVDPVNVKTLRAALERADAEPALPPQPSA